MVKLFIENIKEYKGDRVYINRTIMLEINKCIKELTKFANSHSMNIGVVCTSFIDYTFSNNNIRLSVLASYLNGFYDNYNKFGKLFRPIKFNGEQLIAFDKFCEAYQKQLEAFYQHSVTLERIEITKQAFCKVVNEIDEDEYEDFITAQFDKLEWTGEAVTVFHLNSDKALLRYLEWKKKNKVFKREDSWYEKMTKE